MRESELQTAVTQSVFDQEVGSLTVRLGENELLVIIDTGELEAAYTAHEAREFARGLRSLSDQHWGVDNNDIVNYILDLADVVDNKNTPKAVEEKWAGKDIEAQL